MPGKSFAATGTATLVVERLPGTSGIEAAQPVQCIVAVDFDGVHFHTGIVRRARAMTIGAAP
jgi:hypothetical protein